MIYAFLIVLLLVLSNALQKSMNDGDNTITGGLILALTLEGVNWLVGCVAYRSRRLSRAIEGRPEVLIHNGVVFRDLMERERLTQDELDAALRHAGAGCVDDVHFAVLETNDQVSVRLRDGHAKAAHGLAPGP